MDRFLIYFVTFAVATAWLCMVAYVVYQKYKIRKKSEKLEVEAEMGRSSCQFFHDISGQMSTLAGYIYYMKQNLKESGECEENIKQLDELLAFLIRYTKNAKQIVRDVYKGADEIIDLPAVLHRVVETQANMCFKKLGIEIEEKYPGGPVPVSARAFEAAFNVVRNACEAMENSDAKRLRVSVEVENGFAVAKVKDTGTGMPPNVAQKIFEYGFTTKPFGTGQGMTITKQAVEKSGGRIAVSSRPGEGTEVVMTFPIIENARMENPDLRQTS